MALNVVNVVAKDVLGACQTIYRAFAVDLEAHSYLLRI